MNEGRRKTLKRRTL